MPASERSKYTFTHIIDADHFTIQRVAAKIRKLINTHTAGRYETLDRTDTTCSVQAVQVLLKDLNPLVLEATWRLIRHDLSEDIVMRPAFTTVLGEEGTKMAEHDRQDHAEGRQKLIGILKLLTSFEKLCGESPGNGSSTEMRLIEVKNGMQEIFDAITSTLDDLGKHMAIESGEFLPYFESIVNEEMSWRLAGEYASTLIVTPSLKILTKGASLQQVGYELVFKDEIAYIMTSLTDLRLIYDEAVRAAKTSNVEERYVDLQIEAELKGLQVDKWISTNNGDGGERGSARSRNRNSGKL